jgi:serine/threonine protein kinase
MVNQGENLAYIAPEVALCLPFNEKADIYSFGIILWELLSGEAPYPEMDEVEHTERFIVQGLRPSLTDAEGRPLVYIPSLLANLMKQCWDDEPHRRPSCGEIAAILDEQERILGLGNKLSSCNANQNSSSGCSQHNLKVSSPYPAPHLSSPCPLMKANTNSGIGNKSSGNLLTDILFSFGKKTSFSIQKSSALSKVYVEDFLDLELAGDESTIVTTGSTFT